MSRRSLIAAIVPMLIVPLLMVVTAPHALACSCAVQTFPSQVQRADVVFIGQAIDRREEAAGLTAGSRDPVAWMFAVDRVHKGAAQDVQQVVSARSETSCGMEFEVGETYLVLAAESDGGGSLTTGLCDGTRRLSEVPANDRETLGVGVLPAVTQSATKAQPVAETPSAAEADPWPWLVAGLSTVVVGGFLAVVARWRRRNRTSS